MDAVPSLEHCLAAVLKCMRDTRLRLNPDKTEILWVSIPGVGGLSSSFSFGKATLPTRDEVCCLGVLLDLVLSMENQIASVVQSAYFHL